MRTLAIAGACALLLVVLSYFVGLSMRPDVTPPERSGVVEGTGDTARQEQQVAPVERQGYDVNRDPGGVGNTDPVPVPPKLMVLQVATYDDTPTQRGYADDLMQYLKERRELRSSPVHIFPHVTKNKKLVVCIGPFESARSQTARKIMAAVHSMSYRGYSFKDALFKEITPFRPRP